jgi:hypothetical protein
LGLLPNHRFTPRVEELLARLGSAVAFAGARDLLRQVLGVAVSEATLRQRTYAAGEAALAVERAALAAVLAAPAPAAATEVLQLSVDATKVPLVQGAWTDVKLAAFAELVPGPPDAAGRPTTEAVALSYAARWEPAEQFGATITLEAQRRGLDEAQAVVSPNDGAEWIQGNLDLVAPRAVRILDFPHAVEHLGTIAGLVYCEGSADARAWVAAQRRALYDTGPATLLAALPACLARGPCAGAPPGPDGLTPAERLAREAAYFTKRVAQLDYPAFRARGYPTGSGIVESGHKVVVGARFKGAGQHWATAHLNPLLVLRCAACNERWGEAWPALWAEQCRHAGVARRLAQQERRAARTEAPPSPPVPPPAKLVVDGRPTAGHPWRRFTLAPARPRSR